MSNEPAKVERSIELHIEPKRDTRSEVERIVRAEPCAYLGHRPAYLARGGIACGVCGIRL